MPRDGSGLYSIPPGTHGVSGATISSTAYNGYVDDVATDLNVPRPIAAGGTGASTPAGALANLGGLPLVGGTMTGTLTISGANPALVLNKTAANQDNDLVGTVGGSTVWTVVLGNASGSNFQIDRYNDSGVFTASPVIINRVTGQINFSGAAASSFLGYFNSVGVPQSNGVLIDASDANGGVALQVRDANSVPIFSAKKTGAQVNGIAGSFALAVINNAAAPSYGISITAGTSSSDSALQINNAGNTTTLFNVRGNGSVAASGALTAASLTVTGAVTANIGPSVFTGPAGNWGLQVMGSATTGQSSGLFVRAGTNSSDFPFIVNNQANTLQLFDIKGDGLVEINNRINFMPATYGPWTGRLNISYSPGSGLYGIGFRTDNDSGAAPLLFANAAGSGVGSIFTNATSTTYNTSSDGRLKTDFQPFDAGPIIDALNVYDFAWKATGERSHGVIAQEAVNVVPEAVTHDVGTDMWGSDYSKFVPFLLQELKSLRARVAGLEAAIAAR